MSSLSADSPKAKEATNRQKWFAMIAIRLPKEKVIRTRWSQPVPAFPALIFSLRLGHFHLLSQVVTHIKTSSRLRSKPRLREPQAFPKPKICFRSDLILWVQTWYLKQSLNSRAMIIGYFDSISGLLMRRAFLRWTISAVPSLVPPITILCKPWKTKSTRNTSSPRRRKWWKRKAGRSVRFAARWSQTTATHARFAPCRVLLGMRRRWANPSGRLFRLPNSASNITRS